MAAHFPERSPDTQHRARRRAKEIALATLLTLAAVVFIVTALIRAGTPPPENAPHLAARKSAMP